MCSLGTAVRSIPTKQLRNILVAWCRNLVRLLSAIKTNIQLVWYFRWAASVVVQNPLARCMHLYLACTFLYRSVARVSAGRTNFFGVHASHAAPWLSSDQNVLANLSSICCSAEPLSEKVGHKATKKVTQSKKRAKHGNIRRRLQFFEGIRCMSCYL